MRRFTFVITLVLMLAGSALAQSTRTVPTDPLWGGFPLNVPKLSGVEVSPGTIDYMDSVCWGRTFMMMSDTGSFTLMPNYTVQLSGEPGEYYSKITGGAWTLSYTGGKKNGMLFGEFTSGEIEWYLDKAGNYTSGAVKASLSVKGGTGTFGGLGGSYTSGTFTGVIDFSSGSPEIQGTLELHYF